MARRARKQSTRRQRDRAPRNALVREIAPLVSVMSDVVGPDEEILDQAREYGRTVIRAVLSGAGEGHHHITVVTPFGAATVVGDVRGEHAHLDVNHPALVAWMHIAAADVTESAAGITLRSVTDSSVRVCGWVLTPDGEIEPLDEAEIFSAYCTDADSGEPLSPESGVDYSAAFPLEL